MFCESVEIAEGLWKRGDDRGGQGERFKVTKEGGDSKEKAMSQRWREEVIRYIMMCWETPGIREEAAELAWVCPFLSFAHI